jgi:tetrahedral aminopeptidase
MRKLLKSLTEAAGPSGFEGEAAQAVLKAWEPFADEVEVDRLGSVIAYKRGSADVEDGPRRSLLLAAHLDEIGLVVKDLVSFPEEGDGYGFLRVSPIGGVDVRQIYGQQVRVHASGQPPQELIGVVGALPMSMLPTTAANRCYELKDLVVDTGMLSRELENRVHVGDAISFRQPLRRLSGRRVTGKALDNRASAAAVAVCLQFLGKRQHTWDVMAVATVQEELTLVGAQTSAYRLVPDIAVVVDVTFAKGPGVTDEKGFELGGGPVLGLGPNVHPGIFRRLVDAASSLEMKVHTEPHGIQSATDAAGIQTVRQGVPTGIVSIPLRYMHSLVETVDTRDIKRVGRLIAHFAALLDESTLDELAANMMNPRAG